ncbi:MAG TPA: hypothetical protein GXX18_01155 [Bacillales bacterium]|nr:hypothetical protein [Bacillales bacterium]
MPYPRYQKQRIKRLHPRKTHSELEFSEELTETNIDFAKMQPVPQPKDYDEIEY